MNHFIRPVQIRPFRPTRAIRHELGDPRRAALVFEIRPSEMVTFARSPMVKAHPDAAGEPSNKVEYVSYLHVASVETLAGQAA